MQGIFAIVTLTWKAAFRYRLFWVIAALLLAAVVGLPILIKDDGTVEGFAQILITYTLSAVTSLLGLCTLWLACGTLARDLEECQIQMIAVKPIARWQIWLGKWLGIVTLNAALLAIAGTGIYSLLEYRASKLPAPQQYRLKNEVLVSRASVREESLAPMIETNTDRLMSEALKKKQLEGVDLNTARQQFREQVKAEIQVVAPSHIRPWAIHLGSASKYLKDQPLFVRVKFNVAELTHPDTYPAFFAIGTPQNPELYKPPQMSLSPDSYHEFPIPGNLFDENGDLVILFLNPNDTAMLFPLGDGMEVLYKDGSFALNFVRGLGVILCWMALLTAIGLAAASLLSFPVAAFFSLAVLVLVFSSGTLSSVVTDGTITGYNAEKAAKGHTPADYVIVPIFTGVLNLINLVQQFSPIDFLSSGRSITWGELGLAFAQIVLLMGGIFALAGIWIFNRRELATAQGTQ